MVTKPVKKPIIDLGSFRKASAGGYLPSEQATWVEFRATDAPEDAPTVRVKVRTDLTNIDIDGLQRIPEEGATMADHWAQIAPLVLDWNVQHRADDGQVYDVLPPAEAGPDVFKYIPNPLFWQINASIIGRVYRRVDPKSSVESGDTDDS